MPSDWPIVPLGTVVAVNPKRQLKRGSEAPYIGMADLAEHSRRVKDFSQREFKSGSRFCNGDTLFARITPCLENGKTSQVSRLDDDEVGHGSTEFIVLGGLPGVSDPDFVYYVATSPGLRDYAVSRMIGSSGRQRVSASEIADYELVFPPLPEQRAIAETLGALDDRIEWCTARQRMLYELQDALFGRLYASTDQFRPLGECIKLDKGVSYKGAGITDDRSARPLINLGNFGRGRAPRWEKLKWYADDTKPRHRVTAGSVVVCATDMTHDRVVLGKALVVPGRLEGAAVSHHLYAVRTTPDSAVSSWLVALALNHEPLRRVVASFANGTTVLSLPRDAVERVQVPVVQPDRLDAFNRAVAATNERIEAAEDEAEVLRSVRNTLLPKLLSGELRIENPQRLLKGVA